MTVATTPVPEGTSRVDVLVVLAHQILVRNFVADGCLQEMCDAGLRVVALVPSDTVPMVRTLVPGAASVDALDPFRPSAWRVRLLQWLRLGSFYARRDRDAYALKVDYARRTRRTLRWVVGYWARVARRGDVEAERVAASWATRLRPSAVARRYLERLDPTLVLWPTTISDPGDFEIVQAAARQGRRLVMCEGSWDNLVTKGAIWPRPERLFVWGDFSRRHAIADHGFADDRIVVTGPPHFGVYRDPHALTPRADWCRAHGLDPGRKVIFVAGSTIGFKVEPQLLREISAAVSDGRLPPAYIWYRPHPKVGARFDSASFINDPHVRIDPTGDPKEASAGMARIVHAAEARQRADALAAADVVVSMFSTVVLEGALVGKPVLLVDLKGLEGISGRPTTSYERMAHLRHVLTCPLIRLVPGLEQVASTTRELLALDPVTTAPVLRAFAYDVMRCGPVAPSTQLTHAVCALLGRPRAPEAYPPPVMVSS